MNHERDGITALRRAIDEVAERLPGRARGRRAPAVSWAMAAALLVAVGAMAVYLRVGRPPGGPTSTDRVAPASLGVEVRLLRVNGRDVEAHVFDAARAGTVVVAPAIEKNAGPRPMGAVVILRGGWR